MKLPPHLKNNQGYIMLLSVLFMGAIATSVVVSVLILGLGGLKTGFATQQGYQAKALADLCAQEALLQIQGNADFLGINTFEWPEGGGHCTYIVQSTAEENRLIHIEAEVDNVFRGLNVMVSNLHSNLRIDEWQEFVL